MTKKPLNLNLTPELLGVDKIKIDSVYQTDDGAIHVCVSSTETTVLCRQCNAPTSEIGALGWTNNGSVKTQSL